MSFVEIKFLCPDHIKELLIFELDQQNEVSFWEHEIGFSAYYSKAEFESKNIESQIRALKKKFSQISCSKSELPKRNWNEEWEKSYLPIVLANKYFVRAPFHKKHHKLINFTIMPNMAFGTGHHESTRLIFTLIESCDLKNRIVLDFGCGTGILSILAEYKGAHTILAIDMDEEAVEITIENAKINSCQNIRSRLSSIDQIEETNFDFVIANINRNILLENAEQINKRLKAGGILLLSGFYSEDLEIIRNQYAKYNIFIEKKLVMNNWVGLACWKVRTDERLSEN